MLAVTDMFGSATGGLERAVESLSHWLLSRGHHVEHAALAVPGSPALDTVAGLRVHRVSGWQRVLASRYEDPDRPFHLTLADPGIVRALRRVVRDVQPDIVHAHGWILHSCTALRQPGRPRLVTTLHDYSFVCANKDYLRDGVVCAGPGRLRCIACASRRYGQATGAGLAVGLQASQRTYRKLDAVVAISEAVRDACAPAIIHSGPTRVISSPLARAVLDASPHAARPHFVPATGAYIMFAGDPSAHKGIDVLLEAHRRLDPQPHLVICATRKPAERLRPGPNTTVVIASPHEEIIAAWRHCSVAVVPSVWREPLGLSALEAMASGAAVVASDVGGLKETIRHEVDGLLVPPGDVGALAGALQQLLRDSRLAAELGRAGRDRAQAYSPEAVGLAYERLYREVLDG